MFQAHGGFRRGFVRRGVPGFEPFYRARMAGCGYEPETERRAPVPKGSGSGSKFCLGTPEP